MPLTVEHKKHISEGLLKAYRSGKRDRRQQLGRPAKMLLEDEPSLYYILGAFAGDGCLDINTKNGHGSYRIVFSIGKDIEFFQAIAEAANRLGLKTGYDPTRYHDRLAVIYSKELAKKCADFRSNIPQLVGGQGKAFLAGFYDAEGGRINAGCYFANTDQRLVSLVVRLLHRIAIQPKLTVIKNRKDGRKTLYHIILRKNDAFSFFQQINSKIGRKRI